MNKIFLLVGLITLTACSAGGGQLHKDPVSQRTAETVFNQYIIIGDSLMDMSTDGELTTTASLILLEENTSVVNISLSGQTMLAAETKGVGGAINFLTSVHNSAWRSAVIVELGHNDWYRSTSLVDFYDSYVQFLSTIDRSDSVSVFCVVPVAARWDYWVVKNDNDVSYGELREVIRNIAKTGLCNLIETSDWFTKEDVYNKQIMPDGLHFAAEGHRIYKDRLMEALAKHK